MVVYKIVYTKKVIKDIPKIKSIGATDKVKRLIEVIKKNPFQNPPPYEKLVGDLQGAYSRRINIQHRLVYQVLEKEKTVKIISIWSHYENT
ncbi:MAG: Txe/YoeB family addiction module toxin [Clostridia bacterium]